MDHFQCWFFRVIFRKKKKKESKKSKVLMTWRIGNSCCESHVDILLQCIVCVLHTENVYLILKFRFQELNVLMPSVHRKTTTWKMNSASGENRLRWVEFCFEWSFWALLQRIFKREEWFLQCDIFTFCIYMKVCDVSFDWRIICYINNYFSLW